MSDSKICPSCGAANSATATFCTVCGRALPSTPATAPPPPSWAPWPTTPLRPATASNFLSAWFETWKANFLNFFLVYLVVGLVTGAIGAALSWALFGVLATSGFSGIPGTAGISTGNIGLLLLYIVIGIVAIVVITTIVAGGMSEYAVRRYRGETFSVEQALRRGLAKFWSIFGATLLVVFIVAGLVVLPILVAIPAITAGGSPAAAAIVLGFLVGIIIAIYVGLGLFLYAPAIMIENASALDGLSRSWHLTKGHRISLFLAVIVVGILAVIVSVIFRTPAALTGSPVAILVASALAGAITSPWVVILSAGTFDILVRPSPGAAPGPSPFANPPPPAPPLISQPGAPPPPVP